MEDATLLLCVGGQPVREEPGRHVVNYHLGPLSSFDPVDRRELDAAWIVVSCPQALGQPVREALGVGLERGDGEKGGEIVAMG